MNSKLTNLYLFVNQSCTVIKRFAAYGIINIDYCEKSLKTDGNEIFMDVNSENETKTNLCEVKNCSLLVARVCGIRKDGIGFRIRIFKNECHLLKYNCETGLNYVTTDLKVCKEMNVFEDDTQSYSRNDVIQKKVLSKNIIVVDASSFITNNNNINESIQNFFEATHVLDLPIEDLTRNLNETSRRMLLKVAGPIMVFKPWITIPKNISDDYYHKPTLSSCYHKCPTVSGFSETLVNPCRRKSLLFFVTPLKKRTNERHRGI